MRKHGVSGTNHDFRRGQRLLRDVPRGDASHREPWQSGTHLRFAQVRALGRKVSDEFTVSLSAASP
jgi:hypothetical protein